MKEFFAQFTSFWKGLGPNQKASIIIVAVVSVVAVSGIMVYAARPHFVPLIYNMSPENSASVINYLESNNYVYKVEGNSILVESDKKAKIMGSITTDNVIRPDSVGFELLDESRVGITSVVEGVNIIRAYQGEIEKWLSQMNFVTAAKVIISQSKDSVFRKIQKPTTASVYLTIRPGYHPTGENIESVRAFVAGGFSGLEIENVTVVDQNGRVLYKPQKGDGDLDSAIIADNKLAFQIKAEERLSSKAQEALDLAYGPGKTIVIVSAQIKNPEPFESKEKQEDGPVRTSKTMETEKPIIPGNVGAVSSGNTEAETATSESLPTNLVEKTTDKVEEFYPPSKTITKTMPTGFSIQKISVALWVDKSLTTQDAQGNDIVPQTIVDQVKAAVGWDAARSDEEIKPTITEMPQEETVVQESPGLFEVPSIIEMVKYASQALVVLFLLFFLKGMIKKSGAKKGAEGEEGELPPEVVKRIQARRSTEALISADAEGAARVAKQWTRT